MHYQVYYNPNGMQHLKSILTLIPDNVDKSLPYTLSSKMFVLFERVLQ